MHSKTAWPMQALGINAKNETSTFCVEPSTIRYNHNIEVKCENVQLVTQAYSEKRNSECSKQESNLSSSEGFQQ